MKFDLFQILLSFFHLKFLCHSEMFHYLCKSYCIYTQLKFDLLFADVLLARGLLGDYFILADSTCCTTEMLFQHPFVEGDRNGSVVLVI